MYNEMSEREMLDKILSKVCDEGSYLSSLEEFLELVDGDKNFESYIYDKHISWENQWLLKAGFKDYEPYEEAFAKMAYEIAFDQTQKIAGVC